MNKNENKWKFIVAVAPIIGINLVPAAPFDISPFSLNQAAQKGRNKGTAITKNKDVETRECRYYFSSLNNQCRISLCGCLCLP